MERQAAVDAFELTPLRNATVLSLVFAAFSSLRLVVRKRTISSWPSSSAHATRNLDAAADADAYTA